jgi:hypothetical protein
MKRVSALSATLIAIAIPAIAASHAGERDQLDACQAMVERAAHAQQAAAATPDAAPSDAELARCRQIIREWTLRDSRMSVDEDGRPLR